MDGRRKTVILGFTFLAFLFIAYSENIFFLNHIGSAFTNPLLAAAAIFLNNATAASLIILGMNFYVHLTETLRLERSVEYIVLDHPRISAAVFTAFILAVSILKVNMLVNGGAASNTAVAAATIPHGVIEAYGVYTSIHKTLTRNLTCKTLAGIYLLFLLAAAVETLTAQTMLGLRT